MFYLKRYFCSFGIRMHRLIVIFVFILISIGEYGTIAQNSRDSSGTPFIELNYHYGFIMPHLSAIEYVVTGHPSAFEIKLGKEVSGAHLWEQLYNYPKIGIGYFLCDYKNPDVLGFEHGAYSFINVPMYGRTKRFGLNLEMDFGASYVTKTFDNDDNYKNVAIGTHNNVFFKFGGNTRIQLTDQLELVNGLYFSHCSNGRVKEPNLGINVVTASAGLLYYFYSPRYKYYTPPTIFTRYNIFSVVTSGGLKQWRRHDQNMYAAYSIAFNAERRMNHLERLGIGLDVFYDQSIEPTLKYYDENKKVETRDLYRAGLHLSHDLVYNRLALVFNGGYYFYTKYVEITSIYSRLGLRYQASEHLLFNLTLKSHFAQADFIEWGIGYRWKQKEK